jgi:serine protease Do
MKANPQCVVAALLILAFGSAPCSINAQDSSKVWLNGVKSTVLVIDSGLSHLGSGSIVNLRDGYIITNWHVVHDSKFEAMQMKDPKLQKKMMIIFPSWENDQLVVESEKYFAQARKNGVFATVIASEPKVDLAVMKIDELQKIPKGTKSVKFASEIPLPGSKLISIGNPGKSDGLWIYTPGEVRSTYQKKWTAGDEKESMKHDCRGHVSNQPRRFGRTMLQRQR